MFTTQPESNNLAKCVFFKRHVNMKQNEKGKTNQTARTHAAKRATKMRKTTAGRTQQMNKVKDNISQNMQVFVSHLFVIPAFSSFFFKFSATLWETSVQKVRNKNNAPKKTKQRENVCKIHDFAHLLSLKNSFRARHPSKAAKAASWSCKNEAFVQDTSDWNRNIDDSKGPWLGHGSTCHHVGRWSLGIRT